MKTGKVVLAKKKKKEFNYIHMRKNLYATLFGLFLCLVLLATVEGFFRLNDYYGWLPNFYIPQKWTREAARPLPEKIRKYVESAEFKNYRPNELSIFFPSVPNAVLNLTHNPMPMPESQLMVYPPSAVVNEAKYLKSTGQKIFDVHYHIDEDSRRIVPGQEKNAGKPLLLMMGCSFTFGVGVEDDQTYPYFVSKSLPQFHVYNMGIPAGAVNDQLDDFKVYPQRYKDLKGQSGWVVYSLIEDHLQRATCYSLECYRWDGWRRKKTSYIMKDGQLVNDGTFKSHHKWQDIIAPVVTSSSFLNYFKIDYPIEPTDEVIQKYADQFIALRDKLKKEYNLNFAITEFPVHRASWIQPFSEKMKKANIPIIWITDIDMNGISQSGIPGDGHPNAGFNKFWGMLFANEFENFLKAQK